MKTRKKISIIIAALLLVVILFGGTLAYYQWNSANTNVSFTVSGDGMGASFNGNATVTTRKLLPSKCGEAIKEKITISYYNNMQLPATVSIDLSVAKNNNTSSFKIRDLNYKPTAENLKYLHWAITTSATCTDPADSDTGRTNIANASGVTPSKSDNFTEFANTFTNLNSSIAPKIATVSFTTPAGSGSKTSPLTKTYYLYVWLDQNYTHINKGNVNSDPLQGLSFTLNWNNGTMVLNS